MKEYIRSLEKINHCIEQIESIKTTSPEIKRSATDLQKNIKPCFTEIKKVLYDFQHLIQPCIDTLEKAEDIWQSKIRVCDISNIEIVEELGKLTGQLERIKKLNIKNQQEIIEIVIKNWQEKYLKLKNKYFQWNEVKQKYTNDHLKVFIKDEFTKCLFYDLTKIQVLITENLVNKLTSIYQEMITFINPVFTSCVNSLDKMSKEKIENLVLELTNNLKHNCYNPTLFLPETYTNNFVLTLLQPFNEFNNQSNLTNLFRISLESYDNLTIEIEKIIKKLIIDIFNQKINLIHNRIYELIDFYNNFLQIQCRYKEELLLQHNIEKIWIDEQKKELNKITDNINSMLISL